MRDAGGYIGEALGEPKRKSRAKSPTARTLEELKRLGFTAGVVERFVSFTKKRIDLFGCIDIIAVRDGCGIIGVQATSGSNHSAHRHKAIAEPQLVEWLNAGGRYEIWSWAKQGGRGKRKVWTLRREEIKLEDVQ